jgi:hypothetical protein
VTDVSSSHDAPQFRRYFEGLDLVEPGVVPLVQWRPDTEAPDTEIYSYCGVARKP